MIDVIKVSAITVLLLQAGASTNLQNECGIPAEQVVNSPGLYDFFPNYSEVVRTSLRQNSLVIYAAHHNQSRGEEKTSYLVSDTDGQSWQRTKPPVPNLLITGLKLFDAGSGTFYKFESDQGFRSLDGGRSWQHMKLALMDPSARRAGEAGAILIPLFAGADPSSPTTIFASFSVGVRDKEDPRRFSSYRDLKGIYVSHDGGDNWSIFSDRLRHGAIVALSPYHKEYMLSVAANGVVYSRDNGSTWHPVPQQSLLEAPAAPHGSGSEANATPSTEEDKRYRERVLNQLKFQLFQVAFAPGGDIYLLGSKGLYRWRSGQSTWTWFDVGNRRMGFVNSMALNPSNEREVFVGTDEGILRSTDGGCHFQTVLR